jgi:hypothetical protein
MPDHVPVQADGDPIRFALTGFRWKLRRIECPADLEPIEPHPSRPPRHAEERVHSARPLRSPRNDSGPPSRTNQALACSVVVRCFSSQAHRTPPVRDPESDGGYRRHRSRRSGSTDGTLAIACASCTARLRFSEGRHLRSISISMPGGQPISSLSRAPTCTRCTRTAGASARAV